MQDDVKAALAKMADPQKAAEGQLREGKDAGAELDALSELLDKEWMPALAARLEKLATDEGIEELHATLPAVTRDLLPKFERIYRATGDGIVRQQASTASTYPVPMPTCPRARSQPQSRDSVEPFL